MACSLFPALETLHDYRVKDTMNYAEPAMLEFVKVLGLFAITALAEIVGCYLPWLVS